MKTDQIDVYRQPSLISYVEAIEVTNIDFSCMINDILNFYPIWQNGHGRQHIKDCLVRARILADKLQLSPGNKEILLTGVAAHDLGLYGTHATFRTEIDRENHHIRSAARALTNHSINQYFSSDPFALMRIAECCMYHRSSFHASEVNKLSIEAKITADADNCLSIIDTINRCVETMGYEIKYKYDFTRITDLTICDELFERYKELKIEMFEHIMKKFGRGGYVHFYLWDELPDEWKSILEERTLFFDDREATAKLIEERFKIYLFSN